MSCRLALLACLWVSGVFAASAEPALRLHWTFDHGTSRGEEDASGHGRHCLLVSGANPRQHPPTSRELGAGVFGGTAQIHSRSLIKMLEPVPLGKTWTLAFWLKQTDLRQCNNFVSFPGLESGTPRDCRTIWLKLDGLPPLEVPRPQPGAWEHFALVVAPGRAQLYYNGKLALERAKEGWTFATAEACLLFGAPDIHRLFLGCFDEVRLYDGPLGPEAVAALARPETYATLNFPPVVSAGAAITLWQPAQGAALKGHVEDDGKAPLTFAWRVVRAPAGAAANVATPQQLDSAVTLPAPGDYVFELSVTDGPHTVRRQVNAVVFPPATPQPGPPYAGPHQSPPLGYAEDFIRRHFPPLADPPLHRAGYAAARFGAPPPPGVHPRLFFGPDDLPELRRRLGETQAGRLRLQRLRDALGQLPWVRGPYDLPPDVRNQVVVPPDEGLPVWEGPPPTLPGATPSLAGETPPELQLDAPPEDGGPKSQVLDFYRPFTICTAQAQSADNAQAGNMVNEAFRCLVDADSEGARRVIAVLVASTEAQVRWLERPDVQAKWNWQEAAHDIIGRYGDALIYDVLAPWMTDAERATVRRALALATNGRWVIGLRGMNAGTVSTGNWVCWLMGDYMLNTLALEGEEGFDASGYADCVEAWRRFMTYSFFADSGAPLEAIGKGLMSADKLVPLARRGVPLLASESAYRHVSQFLLQTMVPQGGAFIRDDLHGGIGGAILPDVCAVKHAFPDDPAVDFVYRNALGSDYPGGVHGTTYSACVGLAPLFLLDDWQGPTDWDQHLQQTLKATGGLPLAYFAADTGVMVARNEWSREALHLYFRPRRLGGHRAPNRGTIVVSALGRTWTFHSSMGERAGSVGYSLVTVDGQGNSADDARVVNYQDTPLATFAAADLTRTYARGGRRDLTWNDTRLTPLKAPWAGLPLYQLPQWYDGRSPTVPADQWGANATAPGKDTGQRPFRSACRTAGIVRGPHPYLLILDDLQQDDQPHDYDWLFRLSADVRVFRITPTYFRQVKMPGHGEYWLPPKPQTGDILLCGRDAADPPAPGTPMLLIRVLERRDDRLMNPLAYLQNDPSVMHGAERCPALVVPAHAVTPAFKIMIYPFRWEQDPVPAAAWDPDGKTLSLKWPDQRELLTFTALPSGRTGFALERVGVATQGQTFRFGEHKDAAGKLADELDGTGLPGL